MNSPALLLPDDASSEAPSDDGHIAGTADDLATESPLLHGVVTPVPGAPIAGSPADVQRWFDATAAATKTENDGSLAAAHDSARVYRSRAKADNTRAAYRSAVRAWCAWCTQHDVPPLPASSRDLAAFLAAGRDRASPATP